jgi:hypothetical protein
MYKIKTNAGYFFTVANGRYGRFGTKVEGHYYCEACANKIKENFNELDLGPELEEQTSPFRFRCQNARHREFNETSP